MPAFGGPRHTYSLSPAPQLRAGTFVPAAEQRPGAKYPKD